MTGVEELIETCDEAGNPCDLVARSVVHRQGLWHRASNVLLFRSNGALVIQRRDQSKDVCPGAWDLSAAEHLLPGESHLDGATRGLREELGISNAYLEPLTDEHRWRLEIPEMQIRDFEFQVTFRCISDAELDPQESEVAELREISLDELGVEFADHADRYTPWFIRCADQIGLFNERCPVTPMSKTG